MLSLKNLDELAKKGSELMQRGDYKEALNLFNEVIKSEPDNLYAVYGKAFCLAVSRNSTSDKTKKEDLTREIWELCERLIKITSEFSLFPYLEEHLFPRETLRFAYNAFAWYIYEKATDEKILLEALGYIEHCLSLKSPLDKEESFFCYLDTKVRILLKMNKNEEAYRIVQNVLEKDMYFGDFQDIRMNKDYKNWISGGNIEKYLKGKEGETAHEALMRLQEYIDKFGHEYFEEGVNFNNPVSKEEIEKVERKLETKFPPSYVEFLIKHGPFVIDGRNYKLLSPKEALEETQLQWKSYENFEDDDYGDYKKIKQLFFFQYQLYESDQYVFYMEDIMENGEMSVHWFYHDDTFLLGDEKIDFNKHISELVDKLIEEDNE